MKKKVLWVTLVFAVAVAVTAIAIVVVPVKSYGRARGIEVSSVYRFLRGDTEDGDISDIINSIIANTEITGLPNKSEMSLSAIEGDLFGDSTPEVILTLQTGEKITIVVAYEKKSGSYEFIGVVDRFFSIKNEQIIELSGAEKGILLVREYANQISGALEEATFVRGYKWDDGFKLILNINEEYKSYWNELWDDKKTIAETKWLKIAQRCAMSLSITEKTSPVISVVFQQSYAESASYGSVNLPADGDFNVINARELKQEYMWSSKWGHFVLYEGTYLNGEVAILEDLATSAYTLTGTENNSYRIKQKDGTISVVDKSAVNVILIPK